MVCDKAVENTLGNITSFFSSIQSSSSLSIVIVLGILGIRCVYKIFRLFERSKELNERKNLHGRINLSIYREVIELDIEIRGVIENQINSVYQEQNMLEGLDWILETDRDLTSLNDFALGYFLGSLMQIVVNKAETLKNLKKFEKFKEELKKNPNKRMRLVNTKLTEEETEEIRDIIKRWVIPFREKLNREIDVRNAKAKK